MSDLSLNAEYVLRSLRENAEGVDCRESNGDAWAMVYLDNAKPPGMPGRTFAGLLSALEARGFYRVIDGYAWGEVLMQK